MAKVLELEQAANTEPHNVQKQLAFFQALMDTGAKPGYDVVIARWERMCEFVRVSGCHSTFSIKEEFVHRIRQIR